MEVNARALVLFCCVDICATSSVCPRLLSKSATQLVQSSALPCLGNGAGTFDFGVVALFFDCFLVRSFSLQKYRGETRNASFLYLSEAAVVINVLKS